MFMMSIVTSVGIPTSKTTLRRSVLENPAYTAYCDHALYANITRARNFFFIAEKSYQIEGRMRNNAWHESLCILQDTYTNQG